MKKRFFPVVFLALVLVFSTVLTACTASSHQVTIEVMSSSILDGLVLGGGKYTEGETVTLTAQPSQNRQFLAWIKNNKKVSDQAEFVFDASVSSSGRYTAVFLSENPTYYTPIATAFIAHENQDSQQQNPPILTLEQVEFGFSSSSLAAPTTLNVQENLGMVLHPASQASMIYEFEPDYFFKVYSGYDKQAYNYFVNAVYYSDQSQKTAQTSKLLAVLDMQSAADVYDQEFKYTSITLSNNSLTLTIYVFFAPAGAQVDASNFSAFVI